MDHSALLLFGRHLIYFKYQMHAWILEPIHLHSGSFDDQINSVRFDLFYNSLFVLIGAQSNIVSLLIFLLCQVSVLTFYKFAQH